MWRSKDQIRLEKTIDTCKHSTHNRFTSFSVPTSVFYNMFLYTRCGVLCDKMSRFALGAKVCKIFMSVLHPAGYKNSNDGFDWYIDSIPHPLRVSRHPHSKNFSVPRWGRCYHALSVDLTGLRPTHTTTKKLDHTSDEAPGFCSQ